MSGQLGPATKHQLFPIGRISFPRPWLRPIRGRLGGTEHAHRGNRSTLPLLTDTPHTVLSVSVRWPKSRPPVKWNWPFPAGQDEVKPYLTEEGAVCVLQMISCLSEDVFPNKPGLKSQRFPLGAEVISEVEASDYKWVRRHNVRGLCEAASSAYSRCLWGKQWYLSHSTDVGIQLKTSVGGAVCFNAAGSKDKPHLFE